MADDGPGDWGQPQFDDSSAPDVAVNPTLVADYFAPMVPRRFTTVALLLAATPPGNGYLARADDAPGALWTRVSGSWVMSGIPRFATSGARTTAIASPVLGMKSVLTADEITYRYNGSAWKEWESDWITWTTAPTNLTVGTGGSASSLQRYKWINGRLYFNFKFVFGTSGASMGSSPVLNLPISIAIPVTGGITQGDGAIRDVSVPSTPAFTKVTLLTATTAGLFTYTGTTGSISSTAPMTWAAGDIFEGGFWAEPA